jgi:nucleotide-binding universal stress UspA family protein
MTTQLRAPIVVGIGDEEPTSELLRYIARVARDEERPLRLVHAVPAHGRGPENALLTFDGALLVGEEHVQAVEERVRRLLGEDHPVEGFTRYGRPVALLVELSRDADRVVLQRRDRSWARITTGSVTAGVSGRAQVPVVTVPAGWSGRLDVPGAPESKVTVGVRGDLRDTELMEPAFEAALRAGASLTLLHVWHLPAVYDAVITDRTARDRWSERERLRIVEQVGPWTEKYPGVPTSVEVVYGHHADALVAASTTSTVLILGRPGTSHRLPHLSALSRAVLRESRCPVEIIPTSRTHPATGAQPPVA